jgi:methyl-accepting chemotaxis protein
MATIEFDMDGVILDANANFLAALGYEEREIVGHPHSMFVDPAYAKSSEYSDFWARLRRGEAQTAEFKRFGKGGKIVWIQASYNPILDARGKAYKVVKFATDVTAQKLKNIDHEGQLSAISRSMATIEFDMNGIVLDANANFLAALGYEKREIVGQHHSLFVESSYAKTPEYADFWARLRRGEAQTAAFRRIGKGGKAVWIQASYNPILDSDGKPIKVVKFATDITAQKLKNINDEGQMAAISRSMATIEFQMDGTVTDVNDNFLQLMGYRKDEVVGRHHRMFVDGAYAESQEYRDFWSRLRGGEAQTAEYPRVGKGGKIVWIQGSYNPILDDQGKPYKVVKFATDRTERQRAMLESLRIKNALDGSATPTIITDDKFSIMYANESTLRFLRRYEGAIRQDLPQFNTDEVVGGSIDRFHKNPQRIRGMLTALKGNTRVQLTLGGRTIDQAITLVRDDAGKLIGYSVEWSDRTDEISAQREIERVLKAAVEGNLTERVEVSSFEGFSKVVGEGMNRLVDSVSDAFRHVKSAVDQIAQASGQLRATSQMMASSSLQLNRASDESSKSLRKAADMIKANAENAAMANQLVNETAVAARGGQARMEEMGAAMSAINGSAQQIAKIIKVIDEIAFQTNLLALNAAVEAARAGRHGKGFAVVAQEVRSLAERSAKAAKETAQLIEDSAAKVSEGVKIADSTQISLKGIITNVAKVVDLAGEIATGSGEQASTIRSVSESINQVAESAQAGSQQGNEVSAASDEMNRQMELLRKRMDGYRVVDSSKSDAFSGDLSPELIDQLTAILRAKGLLGPQASVGLARTNGHASTNGHDTSGHAPRGDTNGRDPRDPRDVLPLDRDERGFGGF